MTSSRLGLLAPSFLPFFFSLRSNLSLSLSLPRVTLQEYHTMTTVPCRWTSPSPRVALDPSIPDACASFLLGSGKLRAKTPPFPCCLPPCIVHRCARPRLLRVVYRSSQPWMPEPPCFLPELQVPALLTLPLRCRREPVMPPSAPPAYHLAGERRHANGSARLRRLPQVTSLLRLCRLASCVAVTRSPPQGRCIHRLAMSSGARG
ncbi:uncharacterized protein LOC125553737 [Triticum urartu]|uniref:uncharacterized protein LOC125553737 n=1 Tax=Triticum urartu TaxID=4572 RepID=UPI00204426DE|nr:uncharacterized protein LOC125553737 [Triticum urartu]